MTKESKPYSFSPISANMNSGLVEMGIKFASEWHFNQTDKGGFPYILHCLAVMNNRRLLSWEAKAVGVMHDLLEDTLCTEDDLRLEFPRYIVDQIKIVTRLPKEPYPEFIGRIIGCDSSIAIAVKMADLEHNMKTTRLVSMSEYDALRLQKYHRAYRRLLDAWNKRHDD